MLAEASSLQAVNGWSQDSCWLSANGGPQSLVTGPSPCSSLEHCMHLQSQQGIKKCLSKVGVTVLCNVIMYTSSYTPLCLCCILSFRSKSCPAYSLEEGIIQGCDHQEIGIMGQPWRLSVTASLGKEQHGPEEMILESE